jgi:hypothetical protein
MTIRQHATAIMGFAIVLVSVVSVAAHQKTNRQWQAGTWGDSTTAPAGAVAMPLYGGGAIAVPIQSTTYVIQTDTLLYVGLWRRTKLIPMTVNGPVRFALEKDKLFVIGEDGKEYELKLVKKVLKTP